MSIRNRSRIWRSCSGWGGLIATPPYPEHIFWLVEYANTSLDKDLGEKKAIYAQVGIPEYWVVNLREMIVLMFRDPVNGHYQSEQRLNKGIIHPLAFPDVAIHISQLL